MKKLLFISFFILTSLISLAQPANNNCSGAQNLGTLPTPAACPNGVGANVNVSGTTIGATAPNPYTTLLGCQTGGNQPGPALDVWYRFTASGNQANITISPGAAPFLANPAITLWSGNCTSLTGFNCDNNGTATGNNTATFQPLTPGQTYYIQISGMNSTAAGNFNMTVNASNDCNNCLQVCNLTANPAPVNGTYQPGQTVTFCFTVSQYTQVSANWLHGVIPTFGNGWNLTSLTTTPAASCSGSGTWQWFTSNTSQATGLVTGPGFYYNYPGGGAGNNYGDNGNCTWTFCWTVQAKPNCTSGTNLNISINTTADGETGSWTSPACGGDPNYNFAAVLNCCSTTVVGTPPTCFNGTNGTATATPGGGVAPYTYSWNTTPVQTTQTATNLSPGNYTVTVTDNANCVSTATVNIPNPSQILAPISATNVACNGGTNGQATVNPSGGVGPYNYSWNTTPPQNTQTATGLSAGSYTVTVTSANNCTVTNTVTITQPTPITVSTTTVSSTCGQNNGSATATPSGGVGPYTYSWNTSPIQTTQTATGLLPGSYTVTVTGTGGCQATASVTIASTGSVTAVATGTNVTCFGGTNGSATVTGSGGTGTYTYLWSNGQTTQTINNLPAGTYSVTVTNAGCSATATVTLTQQTQITSTISPTPSTCGQANGSLTVNPSGGVSPYSYLWSNGQTTQTITGLSAGNYSVTITGQGGCSATNNFTLTTTSTPTITISGSSDVSCFGGTNGSATTSINGGVSPFNYLWSNGTTNSNLTGVGIGNYTVTVTDANLCQSQATVTINQPQALSAAITTTNVSCNGGNNGSASVVVSGGISPYTYTWTTTPMQIGSTATGLVVGTYTVNILDANSCTVSASANITQPATLTLTLSSSTNPTCSGSNNGQITVSASGGTGPVYLYSLNNGPSQTSPIFSNLVQGNYTVTVTDGNLCQSTLNVNLTQPQPLVAVPAITTPNCNGQCNGQIVVAINGGTGPYTYLWSNGQTTNPVTGLCAGIYSVTITDANGCQSVLQNLQITQPNAITLNTTSNPSTICIGQQSTLNATPNGGTPTYTYLWTTGGNTQSIVVSPTVTTTYTVQMTDANGCQSQNTVTVTVNPPLTGSATTQPVTICANGTATLTATANGGDGSPYTFTWNPGGVGQTITVNPSSTTTYTVTISDGCSPNITSTVTVNVSPNPTVTYTTTTLSGCEPLTVTYTNTTPNTSNCVWTINGTTFNSCQVTETFPTQGSYTSSLVVTDINGCVGSSTNVIANVYPNPTAAFTFSPSVVNIMEPIVYFNNISSPGNYLWDFGDGSISNSTFPSHTYSDTGFFSVQLIVTTQFGCLDTITSTLYINDVFSIFVPNAFTPNGDNINEFFSPVVTGHEYCEFWIYNRWGEMLYYSTQTGSPWNGFYKENVVQQDVYVWKVHAKERNSTRHHYLTGKVTVIK